MNFLAKVELLTSKTAKIHILIKVKLMDKKWISPQCGLLRKSRWRKNITVKIFCISGRLFGAFGKLEKEPRRRHTINKHFWYIRARLKYSRKWDLFFLLLVLQVSNAHLNVLLLCFSNDLICLFLFLLPYHQSHLHALKRRLLSLFFFMAIEKMVIM